MPGYVDHNQSSNQEFTVNVTITNKSSDTSRQVRNDYDDVSTPPPYESLRYNVPNNISADRRRSGGRKEWDAVAARIANRTAGAKNAAKRLSNSYSSSRVEKPNPRRHKAAGLSIDTGVAKPRPEPKQMFPRETKKQYAQPAATEMSDPATNNPDSRNRSDSEAQLISKFSPETPTILITSVESRNVSPEQRARVASSIYSRMTSGATPPTQAGDVPPLPRNLPELMKKSQPLMASNYPGTFDVMAKDLKHRDSNATAFEEDFDEKKNGRIMSNATLFEEDQYQRNSQLRTGLTMDSALVPTPHRSKGWWNVIRTPFLKSPTEGDRTPDVPAILASAHHTQVSPFDAFGLKFGPQNTHNSQALRRLESKDNICAEPKPSMPAKRFSAHSTFSPNDREVPLMLHMTPVDESTAQRTQTYGGSSTAVASDQTLKLPFQASSTPESARDDFSPVGHLVGEGQVFAAKAVVKNPPQFAPQGLPSRPKLQPANTSSFRSSFTAKVFNTSPQPTPTSFQTASRQVAHAPAPAPYFAPPPIYPYENMQDPGRKDSAQSSRPFPPTRFSSYDGFSHTAKGSKKGGKLKSLFTRKSDDDGKKKSKTRKRRRWCCALCCVLIFVLIILGIVLGIVLGRRKGSSSTQQLWFNVTGFPAIPGGVLTVVRPNLKTSVSGCVNPQTVWSCAVPKEQQDEIKPNDPTQPNFVFDIRMDNSSTTAVKIRRSRALAAQDWNKNALSARDSPVLQASPKPPSLGEYEFLGNTTDGVNEPFEGEETPFYISFKPPTQADFKKTKRNELEFDSNADADVSASAAATTTTTTSTATTSVIVVPDLQTTFPKPEVNSDGTAQAANLLPFPSFQPLRLFNRGTPDEHYGFYTYFERSIFLRSVMFQNSSEQLAGDVPADANGGSSFNAATSRCTWTDTRFKVQIFTNKATSAEVLSPPEGSSVPIPGSVSFVRPGSFPYPITITLDRHGGGATTKMVFCYGLDDRGVVDINARKIQLEDRAFGGSIVNPSRPFVDVPVTVPQGGPGGIDGGSGGCMCEWANWLSK